MVIKILKITSVEQIIVCGDFCPMSRSFLFQSLVFLQFFRHENADSFLKFCGRQRRQCRLCRTSEFQLCKMNLKILLPCRFRGKLQCARREISGNILEIVFRFWNLVRLIESENLTKRYNLSSKFSSCQDDMYDTYDISPSCSFVRNWS